MITRLFDAPCRTELDWQEAQASSNLITTDSSATAAAAAASAAIAAISKAWKHAIAWVCAVKHCRHFAYLLLPVVYMRGLSLVLSSSVSSTRGSQLCPPPFIQSQLPLQHSSFGPMKNMQFKSSHCIYIFDGRRPIFFIKQKHVKKTIKPYWTPAIQTFYMTKRSSNTRAHTHTFREAVKKRSVFKCLDETPALWGHTFST